MGDPVNRTDRRGLCSDQDDPPCYGTTVTTEKEPDDGDDGDDGDGGDSGGGEADGGGGLVPKTPLGASYTAAQKQALAAGYNSAFQHLDDLPCASLFAIGADNAVAVAQNALQSTTYRLLQLPQGPGAGAQTTGSTDVQINTAGVFFNYTTNANSTITVSLPNGKGKQKSITFANATALQGFILLHELGHEVGLFGPDTTAAVNGNFSSAVLSDCFTQTNGVYK
jgi:hypothetical protein